MYVNDLRNAKMHRYIANWTDINKDVTFEDEFYDRK